MALQPTLRAVLALVLLGAAGCQSTRLADDAQRRLELGLRRACVTQSGGASVDAVELFAGRVHTACFRWAHREARRLLPP